MQPTPSGSSGACDNRAALLIHSLELLRSNARKTTIRSFQQVWFDLENAINPNAKSSRTDEQRSKHCKVALDLLKEALNAPAGDELAFEDNIFKALEDGLQQCGLTDKALNQEKRIILKTDRRHAVGIIRQLDVARGLRGEKRGGRLVYPDFCSCLLENVDGLWVVKEGFSMVEFKKGDKELKELNKLPIDFETDHAALGLVISYTIRFALPYHARRGVLGDHLPWTVIAGQIKKTGEPGFSCRWVYGSIVPPEAIGAGFTYTMEDSGYGSQRDGEKVERVFSVLLDTILFGIRSALTVLKNPNITPVPASGQKMMLGGVETTLPLVASPIRGANSIDGGVHWNVSQGDLFRGAIQLHSIVSRMSESKCLTFHAAEPGKDVDVLVKVSSAVAHFPLIPPGLAFQALQLAQMIAKRQLQLELSSVLFAVIWTGAGLITIMTDLTTQGYDVLKPRDMLNQLVTKRIDMRAIWDGLKLLVKDVLLALAKKDIVHPDIRPGFDLTANVLWKLDGGKLKMVLIDLESLVVVKVWKTSHSTKYIVCGSDWNAMTFVAWQCVAVAYAWSQQLDQHVDRGTNCMNMKLIFPEAENNEPLPHLPAAIRDYLIAHCVGEMSEEGVTQVISILDNLFSNTAET